jgi:hypothetical protein
MRKSMMKNLTIGGTFVALLVLAGAATPLMGDPITVTISPKGTCGNPVGPPPGFTIPGPTNEWLCVTIPYTPTVTDGASNGTTWYLGYNKLTGQTLLQAVEYQNPANGILSTGYLSFGNNTTDPYSLGSGSNLVLTYSIGDPSKTWFIPNVLTNGKTILSQSESPEPSTLDLLATGLLAMALVVRKRIADGIRRAT